jgi:hypothetical protein
MPRVNVAGEVDRLCFFLQCGIARETGVRVGGRGEGARGNLCDDLVLLLLGLAVADSLDEVGELARHAVHGHGSAWAGKISTSQSDIFQGQTYFRIVFGGISISNACPRFAGIEANKKVGIVLSFDAPPPARWSCHCCGATHATVSL